VSVVLVYIIYVLVYNILFLVYIIYYPDAGGWRPEAFICRPFKGLGRLGGPETFNIVRPPHP
jgi:hypothetical protein